MTGTADLVPILGSFDPKGEPRFGFRQGVIIAWNADTGQNTVEVGGGQLVDVPMMNSGEAIALKPGHVVGLLTWGATWFILGRITNAQDPDFASATLDFGLASAFQQNFALTTSDVVVASATIACPSWARQALVSMSCVVDLDNPTGAGDKAFVTPFVETLAGPTTQQGFGPTGAADQQDFQAVSTHHHVLVDLPGTPGQTIGVSVKVRSVGAAWAASAFNTAFISAAATFKSTV